MKDQAQLNSEKIIIPYSDDEQIPAERSSFREKFLRPLRDPFTAWGAVLVAISAAVFGVCEWSELKEQQSFTMFLLHYAAAFGYGIVLFFKYIRNRQESAKYRSPMFLWLVLSLISCYALNRSLPIFQSATGWLCVCLVVNCMACVSYVWREEIPRFWQPVLYFFLASSVLLHLYLAAYLLPMYAAGAVTLLALGIGGHTFVPLLISIALIRLLWKTVVSQPNLRPSIFAGLAVPIIFTIYFLVHWQTSLNKIRAFENQSYTGSGSLTAWILIAQKSDNSWVTERILKTGLVYSTRFWDSDSWQMPSVSFSETRQHDPLVTLAANLLGEVELSDRERIDLLKSLYDARHQAQERLWSGDDLATRHVNTNIKVYPDYRLAYTEKIISIKNHDPYDRNQQEAVYTFHLPEGSVVTSLSLWINGQEEAARLTTKAKADSAYKTIVGVESRDPSVVHWQEGNTVTVRVFPCTPAENRRFKIGITSPLRMEENRLHYDNIYFQGPSATKARENVTVRFAQAAKDIAGLAGFDVSKDTIFQTSENYSPDRHFSFPSTPLSTAAFSFGGKSYAAKDYRKRYETFVPQAVYLDVNHAWSVRDFDEVRQAVKNRKTYVWDEEKWLPVSEDNGMEIYEKLWKNRFSLLPLHKIPHPETALVISKSNFPSPNLNDLKESDFAREISAQSKNRQPLRFFNLGHELSPYLRTFLELRALHYDNGNTVQLAGLLKKGNFVANQENETSVTLHQARLQLTETNVAASVTGSAPDHLLRLFAYNHLMQQIGRRYFEKDYLSDSLIAEAQRAYVVSPISSLVVLETKEDYERFGIDKSKNSLQNASLNGSGSVPEPHEWLLIILFSSVALFFVWKHRV